MRLLIYYMNGKIVVKMVTKDDKQKQEDNREPKM